MATELDEMMNDGLLAIASCIAILSNESPAKIVYTQDTMLAHFNRCAYNETFTAFNAEPILKEVLAKTGQKNPSFF